MRDERSRRNVMATGVGLALAAPDMHSHVRQHVTNPSAELAAWRDARGRFLVEWHKGSHGQGHNLEAAERALAVALDAIQRRPVERVHDLHELLEVLLAESRWNPGEANAEAVEDNQSFEALVGGIKVLAAMEAAIVARQKARA